MKRRRKSVQLSLFPRELPPAQGHSATSVQAAEQIAPTASSLRMRLLQWLHSQGVVGATDEEMQLGCPMAPNTQRPRRTELVQLGLVVDTGTVRPTRSGRNATVWIARVKPQGGQ